MASKAPDPHARPAFEKAKILFTLQDPEPANERAWELYTANRQGASGFRGMKGLKEPRERDGDEDEDDDDEDDEDEEDSDEWHYGDDDNKFVLKGIQSVMARLEDEMDFEDEVLQSSYKVLSCDALFEEEDEPRTVKTLTRIYSPTKPTYVDVHFDYHCRSRMNSIEWYYKLGFKIYTRLGVSDYHPASLTRFERGSFESAYSSDGWRPIAYGFFDDMGEYGRHWKRVERSEFKLGHDDILDVYEALCGPLEDLPDDADEATRDGRRRELVNIVRLLLGAVGIDYRIACTDDGRDDARRPYMLEGLSDRWVARETRKACGFQLERDPEEEARGREEKIEEMRGQSDEDEYGYGSDEDDFF
ncbi:hypothetical protein BDZ97DRAFT_1772827 [Flammula alnicola]|nr:hypothetical protein BDZ97DRAFT_1772827 [Flammula alnicola]